jgi:metal-responsive CopG/Arc/MetJ family transcriptional regulator
VQIISMKKNLTEEFDNQFAGYKKTNRAHAEKDAVLQKHQEQMDNLDEHIKNMWKTIMVPYIEDWNNNHILDKLDVCDSTAFWRLFSEKNPVYIHLDENKF